MNRPLCAKCNNILTPAALRICGGCFVKTYVQSPDGCLVCCEGHSSEHAKEYFCNAACVATEAARPRAATGGKPKCECCGAAMLDYEARLCCNTDCNKRVLASDATCSACAPNLFAHTRDNRGMAICSTECGEAITARFKRLCEEQ